jgi:hypothetical protein
MQMCPIVHQLRHDIRALQQSWDRPWLAMVDWPHRVEHMGGDPRPSRDRRLGLVIAGIGVPDSDNHSMINSDLDHLWPWP